MASALSTVMVASELVPIHLFHRRRRHQRSGGQLSDVLIWRRTDLERGAKYSDEYLCLFIYSYYSKIIRQNFTNFLHVSCRGCILLCRRCDTLCTSGFADYVIFYTVGRAGKNQPRSYVLKKFARWRYQLESDN